MGDAVAPHSKRDRLIRAAIAAAGGAAIPTAVIGVLALVSEMSFTRVVSEPGFWIVEALTAAFVAIGVYAERADRGATMPQKRGSRIASHIAWTAGAALLIGLLLAAATETPLSTMLTSRAFLIGAVVAIAVAGLDASATRKTK